MLVLVLARKKLLLERRRERNEQVARVVLVNPLLDLGQPASACTKKDAPLVLLAGVVALAQVHEVDDRLGCEEHERVDRVNLRVSVSLKARSGLISA